MWKSVAGNKSNNIHLIHLTAVCFHHVCYRYINGTYEFNSANIKTKKEIYPTRSMPPGGPKRLKSIPMANKSYVPGITFGMLEYMLEDSMTFSARNVNLLYKEKSDTILTLHKLSTCCSSCDFRCCLIFSLAITAEQLGHHVGNSHSCSGSQNQESSANLEPSQISFLGHHHPFVFNQ